MIISYLTFEMSFVDSTVDNMDCPLPHTYTQPCTHSQMELTNDLKVLLPVMTAVMVAKWVGDFFTHAFFHALLELKCIPFLNQQPNVLIDKKR